MRKRREKTGRRASRNGNLGAPKSKKAKHFAWLFGIEVFDFTQKWATLLSIPLQKLDKQHNQLQDLYRYLNNIDKTHSSSEFNLLRLS